MKYFFTLIFAVMAFTSLAADRPNVLFIAVDDLRPEMGCYGNPLIKTPRWRMTQWRERNGDKVVATELYDHQNDPNETVNLADKPEHASVITKLSKHLR